MLAGFIDADEQGIARENRERTVILCDTPCAGIIDCFYGGKNHSALFALAPSPGFVEPFLGPGIDNAG